MNNVMLIMDQYKRHQKAIDNSQKIDPLHEADELSRIANAFGRNPRRIALVNKYDQEGTQAYHQAGFEVFSVNGDRATEIWPYMNRLKDDISHDPPQHLIVITDDPSFQYLLDAAVENGKTNLAVWCLHETNQTLTKRQYNARPFSELVPEAKVPRVSIRLDYENLHIGLTKKGWQPDCKLLIEAVKKSAADLGQIVSIVAYADWGLLSRNSKFDLQRELASIGVEPRYQLSDRGKNSADMRIADDIRTLVERPSTAPDAVDLVVLGTNDRDFRPTLETAKARGQRIVLLAIKDGLSNQLKGVADEIRYLDEYLHLTQPVQILPDARPRATDPYATLMVTVAAWLRERRWKFAPVEELIPVVAEFGGLDSLNRAADAGLFSRGRVRKPDGFKETLMPDLKHPLAEAAYRLVYWAPDQVKYGLESYGYEYVDSRFMANGMQYDKILKRLGAGQNRHEAEQWLDLLSKLGILDKEERQHPHVPDKVIVTWWLPGKRIEQVTEGTDAEASVTPIEAGQVRQLVKEALSDDELTELCFDHFRPVYEKFGEGMTKGQKVRMLVEYAERQNVVQQLLAQIRQWNPSRTNNLTPQMAIAM